MARIGVVGGGIAGMYCAWKLLEKDLRNEIVLFETLDHLGGRVETQELNDGFLAECGPMRFECSIEPLFQKLVESDLEIKLGPFPSPTSGTPEFPKYKLLPSEWSKEQEQAVKGLGESISAEGLLSHHTTSLDLLRFGLFRIFNRKPEDLGLTLPEVASGDKASRMCLFCEALGDTHYDHFRTEYLFDGIPLYELGFWNALERVLSPGAVAKIRDTGTFYHLMPENPSASEWAIFWLRLFRPDASLSTIPDGVSTIITKLGNKLRQSGGFHSSPRLTIYLNTFVERVEARPFGQLSLFGRKIRQETIELARVDHLVLAIPASPLKQIIIDLPEDIQVYRDGVIPFPLLKVFAVLEKPWWESLPAPQQGAHLVPTREIHYIPSRDGSREKAMIMLYMDRPGTSYWKPYIGRIHNRASVNAPPELKNEIALQVARLLPREGLSEADHLERVKRSIVDFAIRDWSKAPFGAACHAWSSHIDVPHALSRLKSFALNKSYVENVHICGEAYSDYQGFIEGSLRSASKVVDSI